MCILNETKIENMIYEIRGQQVMFDTDLAILYQCANRTKTINLAVKRHIERFPNDFYFQLTKEEIKSSLRFQPETLNKSGNMKGQHIKYLPYVFTEQGVAMLATILRTSVASEVSISIMRAFVAMRKYISSNLLEQKYLTTQVLKNTEYIRLLQQSFSKFEEKRVVNEVYFKGQIYDAYSKIVSIFKTAKKSLIIDRYADSTVLDMISKIKVSTTLIVKEKSLISNLDLKKYNEQYDNLTMKYDDSFHDRYIIVDSKKVYHCGSSINHAGSRTFSINILEDECMTKSLLSNIKDIINS